MSVLEIEVTVSSTGQVTARRGDGAYGPPGRLALHGVDAELVRVFERWLTERDREWYRPDLRAFGGLLHRTLFSTELWHWIEQSLDRLQRDDHLRLQLAFPGDGLAHLAAIPWEYLYAPGRGTREGFFLATDRRCTLTRYIPMELGRRDVALDRRLRVLVLVSQPADLGEVIAEPVLEDLAKAAADGLPIDLTTKHQPTRGTLDEIVPALRPDVVQFIGHGRYDEKHEEGQVALIDEEADVADWVGEAVLAQLLGDIGHMPRLVYLHSCSGAQTDYRASFAGIAPRLIRRGTQCVVAMQYPVTNRTAIAFSKSFYRGLTAGLQMDEAVQAGRRALDVMSRKDPRLHGIPVVYLYSLNALLVPDLAPLPAPEG